MTRTREPIISSLIDCLRWDDAIGRIGEWAAARESRYVCICNVHSVVTAHGDRRLREALNLADMATPDGMPLAWLIGRRRRVEQERISGTEVTLALCELAAARGIKVAFFGSTPETVQRLLPALTTRFPALQVAAAISPPFGPMSADVVTDALARINAAGAGLVFIGLGCPKQEIFMLEHRDQVQGVMIGIGAAFDFIAGTVRRPPVWMQRMGLEWFGRLIAEPRRLWRRYLVTNSLFLFYLLSGRGGLAEHEQH